MLQNIISFSIRNKLIIILLTAGLVIWGAYSFTRLPIDAVPDITNNQVQVISSAPDLAAPEVERLITFPIEQALATIPGKIELRSFSRFGLSLVTIVFDDETDIYWARQQVTEKLGIASEQIPTGITRPELAPVTTGLGEIYQYTLDVAPEFRETYSLSELRTIQDWIVRRQLIGTPGVADVSSFGGYLKQYEVSVRPEELVAMNITLNDVFDALAANNQNTGGSYIEKGEEALLIRTEGLLRTPEDVAQVVVKPSAEGRKVPVLISDVATVTEGHAVRYGAMTRDTLGESVGGVVLMLKGENSSRVIASVRERIATIRKSLPPGISVNPYLDRTKLVDNSIRTVRNNLAEGALIVIFVLVLLLGNFRAGLIVASVIPLAMLFALGMMNVFGVSGNLMSLGAIDFGLIVDGAVIIVEAVIHTLFLGKIKGQSFEISKPEMDSTVGESAGKMMRFAAFGQLIILIVYIPILSLTGIEGKMFKPMAETVSFAIIGALLLSLTWVPVATSLFLGRRFKLSSGFSEKLMHYLSMAYRPKLIKVMQAPKIAVTVAVFALAGSFWIFTRLGGEFIPSLDEGDFSIETRLLTGSSLKESVRVSREAGKILLNKFPEVMAVTGKIGTSEIPTDPMPIEATDLIVSLKPKSEWVSAGSKDELAEKMGAALAAIPGVSFGFQQPIQMRFNELMTGARQDVVVKVFGDDLEELSKLASQVAEISRNVNGAEDIYVEQITGLPQLVISIRRDALSRYGVSVEQVNQVVNTAFAGREAGLIYEGEKRFSLAVRLHQSIRDNPQTAEALFVETASGMQVPLTELADIEIIEGPVQIQREEARRRIIVGFNVRNRDIESVVEELSSRIESTIALPAGYSIKYGGQFENLVEARARLSVAVPLALLLIFVLLFFAFGSIKQAVLIFSAVPFSAIGGVLALYFRGLPFSISAGVGFIALFGVAVLNGIVLVGAVNFYRAEGKNLSDAIQTGALERLRPILMTALVASLGFLPMAISSSSGAEVQRPLATVVIGGLVTATLLTLFLLPVLIQISERKTILPVKPLGAVLVLLMFATTTNAQQNISLDSCIAMALRTHPAAGSAQLQYEAALKAKRTATDIGKLDFDIMTGQYNSFENDFQFSLNQSIPFPGLLAAQSKLLKTEAQLSGYRRDITAKEISRQTRVLWFSVSIAKRRKQLADSLLNTALKLKSIAEIRYTSGESTLVEKLIIEQKAVTIESAAREGKLQLTSLEKQLSLYCGSPVQLSANAVSASRDVMQGIQADKPVWPEHPFLQLSLTESKKATNELSLERMKLFPDFRIGYFNQSLVGIQEVNGSPVNFTRADRFTGYSAGISIPLWFVPQNARIASARLRANASQKAAESATLGISMQYEALLMNFNTQSVKLEMLEQKRLSVSDTAAQKAFIAWQQGEASFLELIYVIEQQFQTQNEWLDALLEISETAASLKYFQVQ